MAVSLSKKDHYFFLSAIFTDGTDGTVATGKLKDSLDNDQ